MAKKILTRVAQVNDIKVPLRRTADDGIGSVPNGYKVADIEIYVDFVALAKALGPRAIMSARGCSKMRDGCVVVKVKRGTVHNIAND